MSDSVDAGHNDTYGTWTIFCIILLVMGTLIASAFGIGLSRLGAGLPSFPPRPTVLIDVMDPPEHGSLAVTSVLLGIQQTANSVVEDYTIHGAGRPNGISVRYSVYFYNLYPPVTPLCLPSKISESKVIDSSFELQGVCAWKGHLPDIQYQGAIRVSFPMLQVVQPIADRSPIDFSEFYGAGLLGEYVPADSSLTESAPMTNEWWVTGRRHSTFDGPQGALGFNYVLQQEDANDNFLAAVCICFAAGFFATLVALLAPLHRRRLRRGPSAGSG